MYESNVATSLQQNAPENDGFVFNIVVELQDAPIQNCPYFLCSCV